MGEHRAEPRKPLMTAIQALWEDDAGTPRVTSGKLEDSSSRGASIRVKEPIVVGSKLHLRWHGG
jgi:hypothetical protein